MTIRGTLEVICGPMFSGKTEELLRRLRREEIGRRNVGLLKPALDNRYSEFNVISHDNRKKYATTIYSYRDFENSTYGAAIEVIGIDEVQFFESWLINDIKYLLNVKKKIIVAGLDTNYLHEPFGIMPHLMAIADKVDKLTAICHNCGEEATRTQRMNNSTEEIMTGDKNHYEARCRNCYRS